MAFNKALVPMCAALVLAVAQVQGGQTVPRDPPFVFLWHAKEQTSDSPRRVIAALWPDGRWLQASDLRGAGNLYRAGRLGTEELQKIVCEIEAIDLWGYDEFIQPVLGPFEGISIRQGSKLKGWTCPLELVFTECDFSQFIDVKKALLGAVSSKTATVTWAGLAPPSWSSRTGRSLDQPRCRRLVDPAGILSQLRPGKEREVIASLWDRQGRWWAVLEGIAAGQDIWLDVAERLRPGSAEDLGMAIGEAFMRAPERVLRRFGPQDVCSTLGFADQSDLGEKAVQALVKRRRSLAQAISAPDLAEQRKACLAEMDKLQAELEKVESRAD